MIAGNLTQDLEGLITSRLPLRHIVVSLRDYRHRGVSRQEVQSSLEAPRDRAQDDEAIEDRIFEIMDVVSGFCSQENRVWDQ